MNAQRLRIRRRLLVLSAPVAIVVAVAILKLSSVVIAGGLATADFAQRDTDALRRNVAILNVLNVVQPEKAFFAAGNLAVLDGRLEYADAQFSASLALTEAAESCPARVNLELVRETLGDKAASVLGGQTAVARYLSALAVVEEAPTGCFTGNTDSDEQRRTVREEAADRLKGKIDAARVAPPPPPPPVAEPPPPPPPPPAVGTAPVEPDTQLRLNPDTGDPLERLQQILRDAAAAHG
jgi:hypothetical protein